MGLCEFYELPAIKHRVSIGYNEFIKLQRLCSSAECCVNQVIHQNHKINLLTTIKSLESKIVEHIHSLEVTDLETEKPIVCWKAPTPGTIKFNVDAAICDNKAVITAVARDSSGCLLKAWAKDTPFLDPTVAEAAAIIWALELAAAEHLVNIIFESDAKFCIVALACPLDESCWKIRHLTSVSLDLTLSFPLCIFSWVKKMPTMWPTLLPRLHPPLVFLFIVLRTISLPMLKRFGTETCFFFLRFTFSKKQAWSGLTR